MEQRFEDSESKEALRNSKFSSCLNNQRCNSLVQFDFISANEKEENT